jgi:hypothetical protein
MGKEVVNLSKDLSGETEENITIRGVQVFSSGI